MRGIYEFMYTFLGQIILFFLVIVASTYQISSSFIGISPFGEKKNDKMKKSRKRSKFNAKNRKKKTASWSKKQQTILLTSSAV